MKKVLSIIITLVLVLSMSVNVFAAENTSQTVTGTYSGVSTEKTVYSVDVVWGSMEFTYEVPADVWNGEEHKYETSAGTWTCASGANAITVTNRSNAALNVSVTTNVIVSGISASVTNGGFTLGSAAESATTEIEGKATDGTATVTLSGALTNKTAEKAVIGSVTVTIVDANAAALTEEEVNAAIEALKNGETVTLTAVSDENHQTIVAAVDEAKDGALLSTTMQGLSTTYSVANSFADAIPMWTDRTTLTLLSDTAEYPEEVVIENKKVILDLNGYKLAFSSTTDVYINVTETAVLTVRDTRGGGEYSNYERSVWVDGVLNIESGTLHNYIHLLRTGTVNMTGGTLYGKRASGPYAGVHNGNGQFNMTGGTISSKYAVWGMYESVTYISGDVVLTATNSLFSPNECICIVTGGTFSHDPSQWVDTENYTVTYNETEGTYVVTAK